MTQHRNGWRWVALFAVMTLFAYVAYQSALFRFASATVSGHKRLSETRVLEIAGLDPGVSRWTLSADTMKRRLLADPWVESATAAWTWSHVRIDLSERTPVGLIQYHEFFYLVLDGTGRVLEQVELKDRQGLPVVAGPAVGAALRGQQLTHAGLLDALVLLGRMAPSFREQVSEVRVEERNLTLYMANGATVLWGQVPDGEVRLKALSEKLETFGGLWNTLPRKRLTGCQIDARVEGKLIPSGCQ